MHVVTNVILLLSLQWYTALTVCSSNIQWFIVIITYVVRTVRFVDPQLGIQILKVSVIPQPNFSVTGNKLSDVDRVILELVI